MAEGQPIPSVGRPADVPLDDLVVGATDPDGDDLHQEVSRARVGLIYVRQAE
jgi:hypothetical protein